MGDLGSEVDDGKTCNRPPFPLRGPLRRKEPVELTLRHTADTGLDGVVITDQTNASHCVPA
jgi:hypothetical protein